MHNSRLVRMRARLSQSQRIKLAAINAGRRPLICSRPDQEFGNFHNIRRNNLPPRLNAISRQINQQRRAVTKRTRLRHQPRRFS